MNFICLALKTGTLGRNQIKEKEDFLFLEPGTNQSMFKNKQICIQLYLHTVHYKLWSLYKFPPRPACVFKGTSA
jgi:hypothetical protein